MLYFYEQDGFWCFLLQKQLGISQRRRENTLQCLLPWSTQKLLCPPRHRLQRSNLSIACSPSSQTNGSLSPFCSTGCCLSIIRAEMAALFSPALLSTAWRGEFLTSLLFPLSLSSQDLKLRKISPLPFPRLLKLLTPAHSNRELWKAKLVKRPRLSICSCGIAIKHVDYPKYPVPTEREQTARGAQSPFNSTSFLRTGMPQFPGSGLNIFFACSFDLYSTYSKWQYCSCDSLNDSLKISPK